MTIQSYENLYHQLSVGPFPASDYTVVSHRTFHYENLNLKCTVFILGESHAVEFIYGDLTFCEIFSCSPLGKQVVSGDSIVKSLNNVKYTFSTTVGALRYEISDIWFADTMIHTFPDHSFTVVDLSPLHGGVSLNTIHTYPHENKIVKTKSLIMLEQSK